MNFKDFAQGNLRGLYNAVTTDTEVFTLALAGAALGAPVRPLRGLGGALFLYSVFRRTDQYVDVLVRLSRTNR